MDRLESRWRVAGTRLILAVLGLAALGPSGAAAACPSIDPTKGFLTNFANQCYLLPLAVSESDGATDLEAIYTRVYFQVNPAYELIVLGTFPNARFMSASVYDDHLVVVGDLKDSAILPLTSQTINPFLPGAVYKPNQMYGLTVSLGGGQPVMVNPGCAIPSSVGHNLLDASQIHKGNTWAGYPNLPPGFPAHETGANAAGAFYVRKYVDIDSPAPSEYVIVRSLANGCAIPIQQAEQMNIVTVSQTVSSPWMHQSQINAHLQFASLIQPYLDFPTDPMNGALWGRPSQYVALNDQDAGYLGTSFSGTQIAELLSGQVYLRLRFQLPTTPTTPCTNGSCSLTGNEQVRYVGLTLHTGPSSCRGATSVFSIDDQGLVQDPNGNVTIVAGFGAPQPSNVTAANYYTWIDLSTVANYTSITGLIVRNIAPNPTFQCSTFNVPYKTSEYNPEGGYMGPYVPTVDFPTAAEIPLTPVPVSRPNSCSLVPTQRPQSVWSNTGYETCTSNDTLSAYSATVASTAGNGNVQVTANGAWTAGSDASWLQLSSGSTGGSANATIDYSYLANLNPGAQTGQLTIGGLPFWLTQVGTSYVPVYSVSPLVSSGLNGPQGVAVGSAGNVYIADTGNNAVEEWSPNTRQATPLVVSGLNSPSAVAVDTLGNVYIADSGNHAIEEFSPSTFQFTTLVSGLSNPSGVAVDGQGNVYFSDTGNNAIDEWNSATQQVSMLVASGLNGPTGVAVDSLGNVYFADSNNNAVDEWSAATEQVGTLVGSGLNNPSGVAVDGQGNVYIADTGNNAIKEWNAATQQVTVLQQPTAFNNPMGVAVDGLENLYVGDTNNSVMDELMPYFLSFGATNVTEGAQAGSDSVSLSVLPTTIVVTAISSQPWLTIKGVSNGGSINFSFKANDSFTSRSAGITVLGETVTVTQSADVAEILTKTAGLDQSTGPGQPFAINLRVRVTDSAGNAISGVPVTFTVVPAHNGASGTFSASPPMPILTDAYGRAIAPTLTANSIPGTFSIAVTAGNLSTVISATITSPN
jgi:sugar lactone lactonase YvrE